jgi:hypothetical protein
MYAYRMPIAPPIDFDGEQVEAGSAATAQVFDAPARNRSEP